MPQCSDCKSQNITLTDSENDNQVCPAIGYQKAGVCVPVTVTPYAKPGSTVTTCCGSPVIVSNDEPCSGTKNGSCVFTMKQTICVAVPVSFGADSKVGDPYVECLGNSDQDICKNCTPED